MDMFKCLDCAVNTSDINEYYMIQFDLWQKINPQEEGMLCIGCVESRLGRTLESSDFTDCPLNEGVFGMSSRMRNRLAL